MEKFNLFNSALQKEAIKLISKIEIKRLEIGWNGEHLPIKVIFGRMGTGKSYYVRNKAASFSRPIDMFCSTPTGVYQTIILGLENLLSYPRLPAKGEIADLVLEGYDGSDIKFNQLLQKLSETGISVAMTTQYQPVEKNIAGRYQLVETGYPRFDYREHPIKFN